MKLTIHGKVQGVGYRYAVLDKVESEQVTVYGQIQNLPNGTVELIAQGTIEALKDLRRIAVEGSLKSSIRDVEEVFEEISEVSYEIFSVAY
jgi:acylphosphatase